MKYTENSRFAEYVTNIAFHLSLSRSMCSYLLAICEDAKIKDHQKYDRMFLNHATTGFRDFITTGRSLESRGLIRRVEYKVKGSGYNGGEATYGRWLPTEEGKLVAELVRRATASTVKTMRRDVGKR